MKKIICSSILLATTGSLAAAITGVTTGTVTTGGYEIIFKNAGVIPTAFNTNSPASIVLDFPNTTSSLATRETAVNQNGIYSVNVIPGDHRTRAVVNLANPSAYDVKLVGSDVHVILKSSQANTPVVQAPVVNSGAMFNIAGAKPVVLNGQQSSVAIAPSKATDAVMSDLSPMFHKNSSKGGVLSFTLPSRDTSVRLTTEGSSVIATIVGYSVPKSGQKRLDVADYGSPVRYVDILPKGGNTRVVLNMGNTPYEYVTYQNGSEYNIEIKQPAMDEDSQRLRELAGFGANKQYSGAPLSLNFQDIEVRAVLQIIAEFTNNNIVVSDTVVGNITLRLDNVPWDQALDIIMKTKGLAMRKVDRVIYIAPEAELNSMEIEALRAIKEKETLQPTMSEVIHLKYARASDIAEKVINKSAEKGDENSDESLLSGKGSVTYDDRTNTLVINDIASKIQRIRELVAILDEPVRQVLVDARLVVTNDDFKRDIGSRFGLTFANSGYDLNSTRHTRVLGTGSLTGTSSALTDKTLNLGNRLGVDLAAGASNISAPSYGISILGSDVMVDLELSALQAEGRSEVVSSPRVVTQDGQKAVVAKGQEIPYTTVSSDGSRVEFKDAKLSLEVTPYIAPNDRVTMEIYITKDAATNTTYNGEPSLETNELQTKVEVENGETLVLGGVYEQTQSTTVNKVPVIGDIPVIGNLFKNTNKTFDKDELLVFITPRILEDQLTDVDKFSNLRR